MSEHKMAKTYDPKQIDAKWYEYWENRDYFSVRGEEGASFCIVIPPPNVTGTLHMGHAFQDTLMDILIRYHRMRGYRTLWQPGMDHAGIATQMVVERQLSAEGKTRHDLGREAFVERIWQWKEESGGEILRQLRRLGASLDWSRERFTMDETMSKAVRTLFVKLYDDGLIYRGKRLVNWDPVLKTAISDLEVENREEQGYMYHVRYPFVVGQGMDGEFMYIATTRPETILADGALAVAPGDQRYAHLIGKMVHVPMTERTIPIIEDEYVDPEFGTGCVKITPAHDFNDYQVGTRHEMEVINLMTPEAIMNDNAPEAYRGLDRFAAREKIVADLEAAGLLLKVEAHTLKRPYGDRSGVVIEPYLTDQWFVDLTVQKQSDGREGGYNRLTKPAIDAVRDGRIKFVPKNWENTYFNWMENLQDWCISRQLWWGHRIPAWYDDAGHIYVAENEAEVRRKYGLAEDFALRRDDDVLDTWFSSALWPFATQGWPEETADLAKFYPGSVLVTGFDIIFFWVARMVLMGLYCMDGEVPFHDVYIHGLVRDSDGNKMSKSKGNIIDPIDVIDGIDLETLIDKRTSNMMQPQLAKKIAAQTRKAFPEGIPACGTDALRFTFAAQATTGRDVVFDMKRTEGHRNFCNKIWNAARFVLMQTEGQKIASRVNNPTAADIWIRAELSAVILEVEQAFQQYRFDFAARAVYDFLWHDYCDWYLELTKPLLYDEKLDEEQKAELRLNLLEVLETAMRLIHPIMPYISEEIWQQVAPLCQRLHKDSIMLADYPKEDEPRLSYTEDEEKNACEEIKWLQELILGVRKIRADMNIAPSKALPVLLSRMSDKQRDFLARQRDVALKVGRLQSLDVLQGEEPDSAAFMVGDMKAMIPLSDIINKEDELKRLDKEITRLQKNIDKLQTQINNPRFVKQAPTELVKKTRATIESDSKTLQQLSKQREKVASL